MIPWRREWQPTPVFLPRELHGQRSLVGYSPWHCKESDMTKQLSTHVIYVYIQILLTRHWKATQSIKNENREQDNEKHNVMTKQTGHFCIAPSAEGGHLNSSQTRSGKNVHLIGGDKTVIQTSSYSSVSASSSISLF